MRGLYLALALLSGCASQPVTTTVSVPVPVPCSVPPVAKPIYAFDVLPADASLFEMVRALVSSYEAQEAYVSRLEAAVAAKDGEHQAEVRVTQRSHSWRQTLLTIITSIVAAGLTATAAVFAHR